MAVSGNGVMTKEQVAAFVASAMNEVFHSRGAEPKKEYYKSLLKEFKADTAQLITQDIAYFGNIGRKEESEPIAYDDIVFGNKRITEAGEFAQGFRLTKSALIMMGKKPQGEFTSAKIISLKNLVERWKDAIRHTKETLAAKAFLTPNSAVKTSDWIGAGRDGKALAASDHPLLKNGAGTMSNLLTPESISQSAIGKMVAAMMTQPSPEGLLRALPSKFRLVVGPKLANRAFEITKTRKSIDNDYNNESILNQYNIDLAVLPYMGADSTAYTLLGDGHRVGYFAPVAPEFEDERDFEVKGWKYSVYFQYIVDFLDPYDFFWCAGA
jgi:hypothetical protein